MACLPSSTRTALLTELATIESQLTILNATYTASITNGEVEEYSFNSGEGQQRTKRRSLKEIREEIENLEARKARIMRRLDGTGIVNLNLRRKSRSYYRR